MRWLMAHSEPHLPLAPVTIVRFTRDRSFQKIALAKGAAPPSNAENEALLHGSTRAISPLEYALFLQSVLAFEPPVVALEPVLNWKDRDKDQQQVFIDQAMRVPKLLLGAHLSTHFDPDEPVQDLPIFTQVSGSAGELPEFMSVDKQPEEDLRLISAPGFVNLPDDSPHPARAPLLFRYRSQVVPSFALHAVMLWLRISPAEVKIELGSRIILPDGAEIPIRRDGTMTINPNTLGQVRQVSLEDLLLAAQQRDAGKSTAAHLENLREQIVILRAEEGALTPPNVFGLTIATIQNHAYVRRVGRWFDVCAMAAALLSAFVLWRRAKAEAVLIATVLAAAYLLIALGTMSQRLVWLPGWMPLGLLAVLLIVRLSARDRAPAR